MNENPYQSPREEGFQLPEQPEDLGAAILAILITLGISAVLMFVPLIVLIRVLGL